MQYQRAIIVLIVQLHGTLRLVEFVERVQLHLVLQTVGDPGFEPGLRRCSLYRCRTVLHFNRGKRGTRAREQYMQYSYTPRKATGVREKVDEIHAHSIQHDPSISFGNSSRAYLGAKYKHHPHATCFWVRLAPTFLAFFGIGGSTTLRRVPKRKLRRSVVDSAT